MRQASSTATINALLYILYYAGCPATLEDPYILRGYDETALQSALSDATITHSLSLYPPPPLLVTLSDSDVATAHIYTWTVPCILRTAFKIYLIIIIIIIIIITEHFLSSLESEREKRERK